MNVAGKHKWNIICLILIKETGREESISPLVFIKSLSIQKEIIGVISILTTVHLSTIIILHHLYCLVWCKFIGNGDRIYISKRLKKIKNIFLYQLKTQLFYIHKYKRLSCFNIGKLTVSIIILIWNALNIMEGVTAAKAVAIFCLTCFGDRNYHST